MEEQEQEILKPYYLFIDGSFNTLAYELSKEAFEVFESAYDTFYGSIGKDENLIEIHTGGWSDNEFLIEQLQRTGFWTMFFKAKLAGGHYYFDLGGGDKEWSVVKVGK